MYILFKNYPFPKITDLNTAVHTDRKKKLKNAKVYNCGGWQDSGSPRPDLFPDANVHIPRLEK
jgi:hypothetical protein